MLHSTKLRGGESFLAHWCPGCGEIHIFTLTGPGGPVWAWNGDVEAPTCTPSMLVWPPEADAERVRLGRQRCHYFLREGHIQYLADCTHALAGQTIDLPDLPMTEWY